MAASRGHVAVPSIELDRLITEYFYSWRSYSAIVARLKLLHGVCRSTRWLKNQLSRLGLKRRSRAEPSSLEIGLKIKTILATSDAIRGYRSVWKILRDKYDMVVKRDTVMQLLQVIDPDGVLLRSKKCLKRRNYRVKGPNHVWHVDGYDKLTPFGLTVHGCIDGFSRKLMWLKIGSTNHNPRVIVHHFLMCVERVGGCPAVVRCDYSTENTSLATVQIAFRLSHTDSLAADKSFVYGPSKSNIRIEAFWSQLRRAKTNWWIEFFKDLEADGHYDGSNFHRQCLAFVFSELLQRELDDFVNHWNGHPIRSGRNTDSPGGYPDDLYDLPELFGAVDCMKEVDEALWQQAVLDESQRPPPFFSNNFKMNALHCIEDELCMSHAQITTENMKSVYLYLTANV